MMKYVLLISIIYILVYLYNSIQLPLLRRKRITFTFPLLAALCNGV